MVGKLVSRWVWQKKQESEMAHAQLEEGKRENKLVGGQDLFIKAHPW